tara:strand:+ start:575 stop:943 length:369 start_codon:yes stop_codon:yes gene_type:complete
MSQNTPSTTENNSETQVKEFFNQFFTETITFPTNQVDAVVGFFEKRGFDKVASISTATILLQQAKIDNVNVFQLIDTLGGLETAKLSYMVTEVLNHNRSKISSLGYKITDTNEATQKRNIVV